jgi:alpha-1,2-mannosyltransferase
MEAADGAILTAGDRWRLAGRRAGTHSLLIWPPLALAVLIYAGARKNSLAIDFAREYLPAAHKIIHGHSPYAPITAKALAQGSAFAYPPLTAWLVAPFTAVPRGVAEALAVILATLAVAAALRLIGVHDWRCFMIALLWVPTFAAIQTGNIALPLTVGVAAIWRFRDRRTLPGILVGLLIALKLYLWPLAVWLLFTRRNRDAVIAAVTSVALVVASWAPIGFADVRIYPHLVASLARKERGGSYSVAALLAPVSSWMIATVIGTAFGVALLALAWRRAHLKDERGAFVWAIAATLTLSPIVWMDYFVVLLVVIGLYRRSFAPIWALPLPLWVGPQVWNGRPWQTAAVLLLVAATFVVSTRTRTERQPSTARESAVRKREPIADFAR